MKRYPATPENEARFWAKVAIPADGNACWLWTGNTKQPMGYGLISLGHRHMRAHRVMLELCSGAALPRGLFVCHACDNPQCVSPLHLFLGTPRDNYDDMRAKGRAFVPPPGLVRGDSHPNAKLTRRKVKTIRAALQKGKRAKDLARRYGVSQTTISQIRNRIVWRDA